MDALPQNYTDVAPDCMKTVGNNLEVVQVSFFSNMNPFPL